jgi:hypothetical protein
MNCKKTLFAFVASVAVGALLSAQEAQKPLPIDKGDMAPATAGSKPESGKVQIGNPQSGNAWFPVTDLDLGTYFGHEEAVGSFRFKNPKGVPVQWRNLTGSCTCTKAVIRVGDRRYELVSRPEKQLLRVTKNPAGQDVREVVQQITVGPDEEGEVEVHMEMVGISGPRQATLDIHSTDEKLQQIRLKWHATGAQMFVISPAEVNLNKMTWNETKEFTVTVTSPLHKDFNIKRMDPADKAFTVTWDKTMNGDAAVWTIKGKYGPLDGEAGGGGVLKFYSDIQGESSFLVRVMAFVQGPFEVKPGGFLPLGRIQKGTEFRKEVVFEPNDGTKLEATKMTFEKMTMAQEFVTASQKVVDGKLVVELHVSPQAPLGLLKGELLVELNHPKVKEKRIIFNGFVR